MIEDSNLNQAFEQVRKHFEDKVLDKKKWKKLLKSYVSKDEVYKQNWAEYDLAKTNEDIFVKRSLHELLAVALCEPENTKRGRKRYSLRDKIFSMCIKAYYRCDLRKCRSILKGLKNLNFIEKVPSYKSIDNFFNDKDLNKILDDLILISALPVASIEEIGAIDSTGFSTSRFDRWSDRRYGKKKESKKRLWRKLHAVIGCKSNIFIASQLTEQYTGDATMVESVIGNKTKYFVEMDSFVADRAYSSRRVLSFINQLGLTPFIPFKRGTTGKGKKCSIWQRMFVLFLCLHQEYMRKYHLRGNIEANFHMLKQRFGDHLSTKNFVANVNEIKVKILCHNLCCLLVEAMESGISVDFEACVKKVNPV